MNKRYYLWS